jgi:hypothetical protein
MKTRSIFYSALFAASAFAFLTNCTGNKKDDGMHDHAHHDDETAEVTETKASAPQFQVDENFQQQLGNVFTAYVSLKEAFVSSDVEKVKAEALKTSEALGKVDMKLLSGAEHNDWMTYLSPMEKSLKEMQSAGDIEAQRTAFSTLSESLYKSIKAFGLGGKEAFYEFCPMAFSNQGAYWLSDQEKIRNPYFGDKMLSCGEVTERLK